MASVNKIQCPTCGDTFLRTTKQINQVVKRSGIWRCKRCVLTERNKRNARPIGATRVHAQSGYVEEKTASGWRRQHILVMERHIGRRLRAGEVVHHVNEIKTDNRLTNLMLMDHGEHTVIHHTGARRGPEQRRNIANAVRASSVAKLTPEKATTIRRIARDSRVTQRSIAEHFSVSPMTISRVINHQTWNSHGKRK